MSTHKHFDKICIVAVVLSLILTIAFMNGGALGIQKIEKSAEYESRIFDNSVVHTLDIVMNDWEGFIETCENEVYETCAVVIDGEAFKNVAIRAKGNTSLSMVRSSDSNRYSFKIEFDHYDSTNTYYGLDKLSLNNIIQDNTYMKDYLTYRMMNEFGAVSPLCSFVNITVNGEPWGLYLAVEAIEESFLQRNYGNDYGELYKPDSMSFGGGRGNGKGFDMDTFLEKENSQSSDENATDAFDFSGFVPPDGFEVSDRNNTAEGGERPQRPQNGEMPEGVNPFGQPGEMPDIENMPDGFDMGGNKGPGGMGSDDVKLKYIDDSASSYSNIFDSAKTDVSDSDKTRLINALKNLSEEKDLENTVNVDDVIKYFVVHNYVCNGDSYTGSMIHNYYLYEKDGQLSMIPWDYNLAFGSFQSNDATSTVNSPIDTPVSGGATDDRPMVDWIFSSEEYTEKYHQYFSEFISSVDIEGIIEETRSLISSYVKEDVSSFCTYDEFLKAVDTLKEFCSLRAESVSGQLSGEIPSTTDGQKKDSSKLVDASKITVSDMGSMGRGSMGGDKGFGNKGNNASKPQQSTTESTSEEITSEETTSEETTENTVTKPSAEQMPTDGEMPSGDMPGGFTPPEGGNMPSMPEGGTMPSMPEGGMPPGRPEMPTGAESI